MAGKKTERVEGEVMEGIKKALKKMAKDLHPPTPVRYYIGSILEEHVKKSKK